MTWFLNNLPQIGELLAAHLGIAVPAIVLSVLIGVPIGRIAHASGRARGAVLTSTSLLYALPSLPLIILIPILTGLPLRSHATLITALTVYGVALLVRSAADAFATVPPDVRAAADATGYPRWRRVLGIELPLAMPVLIAATRVVAMSSIGLTTIGALIGIPSLGSLFTDGFQRGIAAEVTTGIVLTVVVALAFDAALLVTGRLAQPWVRATRLAAGAHA